MEDKAYLEEGFDAKSLKVAELRGILHEYNVKFSSNAKKQQLVKLFNSEIKTRAKELLEEHNNAIKNSNDEGFVDVKKESESESNDDEQLKEREGSKTDLDIKKEEETSNTEETETEKEREESEGLEEESKKIAVKKDHSPFTSDNVFQTPDNSLELSQKKKRRNDDDLLEVSKRMKSNVADVGKSIFDSSSDSEVDNFQASIIERTPLKIKKSSSRLSTPTTSKRDARTPKSVQKSSLKKNLNPSTDKLTTSSDRREEMKDIPQVTDRQELNDVVNSNNSSDVIEKNISAFTVSGQKPDNSPEIPQSLEDEEASFDKGLKQIKQIDPNELAAELGITIQGNSDQPKISLESNFSTVDTSYTPQMPLIPPMEMAPAIMKDKKNVNSDRELSDEDDEIDENESLSENDESDQKLDLLESNIKEAFKDLSEKINHNTPKTSPIAIISFILIWILLMSTSLFGYWYREQTILVGFCGNEINRSTFPESDNLPNYLVQFGDYLDKNFKPKCKPCPLHARCYSNLELGCYEDFVEYKPWYSFIVPTEITCVPDTKRAEKLEIMIDVALDLLRSKNAEKNCGRSPKENLGAGVRVDDLHDVLLSMKAPYITTDEFEELWRRAIIELEKEPEIIVRQVTFLNSWNFSSEHVTNIIQTGNEFDLQYGSIEFNHTGEEKEKDKILRSTSLSNIGLKCQLQNTLVEVIIKIRYFIIGVIGVLVIFRLVAYAFKQKKLQNYKVQTIYGEVIKKLIKQRSVSRNIEDIPPYIGVIQLRDLILINEKNLTKRINLWSRVSSKVDTNSNVRSRLIENHGEIMKVWEWISDFEISTN